MTHKPDLSKRKYPEDCYWPDDATFRYLDENPADEHNAVYIVFPDGCSVALAHCADPKVDPARAKWIVDACNAYREEIDYTNLERKCPLKKAAERALPARDLQESK